MRLSKTLRHLRSHHDTKCDSSLRVFPGNGLPQMHSAFAREPMRGVIQKIARITHKSTLWVISHTARAHQIAAYLSSTTVGMSAPRRELQKGTHIATRKLENNTPQNVWGGSLSLGSVYTNKFKLHMLQRRIAPHQLHGNHGREWSANNHLRLSLRLSSD